MAINIRGASGEVRWGYHRAASVTGWEITDKSLTARTQTVDAFAVSQRPLTFVGMVGKGQWKWPIDTIHIEGTSLHATLGPEEQ